MRILVVEDEVRVAAEIAARLESLGFFVNQTAARTVDDANALFGFGQIFTA